MDRTMRIPVMMLDIWVRAPVVPFRRDPTSPISVRLERMDGRWLTCDRSEDRNTAGVDEEGRG